MHPVIMLGKCPATPILPCWTHAFPLVGMCWCANAVFWLLYAVLCVVSCATHPTLLFVIKLQIDLRFDSTDQGKLKVVVAPVLRFREVGYNADVRIDSLAPPQKMIEGEPQRIARVAVGIRGDMAIVASCRECFSR